jgi:hypothetical protein
MGVFEKIGNFLKFFFITNPFLHTITDAISVFVHLRCLWRCVTLK